MVSEDKLDHLALLSIEWEIFREMDVLDVIGEFARKSHTKKPFIS